MTILCNFTKRGQVDSPQQRLTVNINELTLTMPVSFSPAHKLYTVYTVNTYTKLEHRGVGALTKTAAR